MKMKWFMVQETRFDAHIILQLKWSRVGNNVEGSVCCYKKFYMHTWIATGTVQEFRTQHKKCIVP